MSTDGRLDVRDGMSVGLWFLARLRVEPVEDFVGQFKG